MHIVSVISICIVFATRGSPSVEKDPNIINGEIAAPGQFPWQAGILSISMSFIHLCSGAIISEDWILTAGYCLDGADSVIIYTGSVKLSEAHTGTNQCIIHENFDRSTLSNDIAVIRLNESLVFDDNTQPIALASEPLEDGSEVVVSGWGQTLINETSRSDSLIYMRVHTIANSECEKVYGSNIVTDRVVCTSDAMMSPCLGDTGDPAIANLESGPVHVAIFSFLSTFGCGSNYPVGYTRTASFREWIKQNTGV